MQNIRERQEQNYLQMPIFSVHINKELLHVGGEGGEQDNVEEVSKAHLKKLLILQKKQQKINRLEIWLEHY